MTIANFNPAGRHAKTLPSALHSKHKVAQQLIILMFSTLSLNTAHAALTATTANTIKGSQPYLELIDGTYRTKLITAAQLQGFYMPKRNGSAGKELINIGMASAPIAAPSGMKFQDVTLLVAADGNARPIPNTNVKDEEGDASILVNTSTTGAIKATWYEGVTPITQLNQTLTACGVTGGVYTLKVEIPTAISANTTYGDPNTKSYGTASSVTYTFTSSSDCIRTLKPSEMMDRYGYNAAVWETGKGFNVINLKAAGKTFPTTGFPNAILQVMGSGSIQTQYECKKTGANWVSLSTTSGAGTNCTVTYLATSDHSKPQGSVTIELGKNISGTWTKLDDYTIPPPTLWAEAGDPSKIAQPLPTGLGPFTNSVIPYNTMSNFSGRYLAAESCYVGTATTSVPITGAPNQSAVTSKFFSRTEFSKSLGFGYFYRDADKTFTGEWGQLQFNVNSPFAGAVGAVGYWTNESNSSTSQFSVDPDGQVSSDSPNDTIFYGVICKRN